MGEMNEKLAYDEGYHDGLGNFQKVTYTPSIEKFHKDYKEGYQEGQKDFLWSLKRYSERMLYEDAMNR